MGCSCSRLNFAEEDLIQSAEETIGFDRLTSFDIDMYMYRFAIKLTLTISQLKAVFESLNLNAANFHDEGSPIANFYNNFKIENSLYCPRKLSSLGVLLGKGSIIEKANVLFKNYDTSVSDSLEYNEILVLITDILEIALIFIPKFAQALAKNEESKKCIAKYHLNFSENFKSIHEYYKKLLIEPETVNLKVDKFL